MRWSDRTEDNVEALLRANDRSKLGAALAELREHNTAPSDALRARVRAIVTDAEERAPVVERKPPLLRRYRPSFAHVAVVAVAFVGVTAVITAVKADGDEPSSVIGAPSRPSDEATRLRALGPPTDAAAGQAAPRRQATESRGAQPFAPAQPDAAAPVPSPTRAQDYRASIKLHVADHAELSDAVQSAIRTTRELGGYVTYVDYGTSGKQDGEARLAVRIPVRRVQAGVARFSQLGTILEQQTEIVDLQARVDRITRDLQRRRDRIAKLEAELKDPTLGKPERERLEARIVRAKRGLAAAQRSRAGVLRQSRYAKLDLAFTTKKRKETAAPPGGLEKTLDDASGVLMAELGVVLYILVAGAPFIALALLAWLGARAARRAASQRVLERA